MPLQCALLQRNDSNEEWRLLGCCVCTRFGTQECVCICNQDTLSKTRNRGLASAASRVPALLRAANIDLACRASWVGLRSLRLALGGFTSERGLHSDTTNIPVLMQTQHYTALHSISSELQAKQYENI
jgi:hypothetical protein